ncbi:hypothetical protein FXO38_07143 [Capsicum annuum]|nr:hypothetical protein FXO37_29198 [Capsicum annuum]KAF3670328.1 hypothetical protein FXO38_07143 [Capsicum annuum]
MVLLMVTGSPVTERERSSGGAVSAGKAAAVGTGGCDGAGSLISPERTVPEAVWWVAVAVVAAGDGEIGDGVVAVVIGGGVMVGAAAGAAFGGCFGVLIAVDMTGDGGLKVVVFAGLAAAAMVASLSSKREKAERERRRLWFRKLGFGFIWFLIRKDGRLNISR